MARLEQVGRDIREGIQADCDELEQLLRVMKANASDGDGFHEVIIDTIGLMFIRMRSLESQITAWSNEDRQWMRG